MMPIKDFFRLIRWLNLLYIVLTMYFVREFILKPATTWQLTEIEFALLVLSTVLIAAGGYVINDYFDVKMDVVNRHQKIVVDKTITRRKAMMLHQLFSFIGIVIGVALALDEGTIWLSGIQLLSVILLWFYSTTFKRKFVVGNLIVAALSATVVLTVTSFEMSTWNLDEPILKKVILYSVIAFLVSWVREIVKDMEDIEGDRTENCRTMPIVVGISASKLFAVVINLAAILLILSIQIRNDFSSFKQGYIFFLIQTPLLLSCYFVAVADTPGKFHFSSNLIKLTMLTGIFSMPAFYFLNS